MINCPNCDNNKLFYDTMYWPMHYICTQCGFSFYVCHDGSIYFINEEGQSEFIVVFN